MKMLLSSLIQTYSIQNVLKPIAETVSELLVLTEDLKEGTFAELAVPADNLRAAVKRLTDAGLDTCKSSNDEQFHREMTAACMQSSKSAASLTQEVEEMSTSVGMTNCKGLYSAVEGIMEGTMKILLAWDDSEVRRIIRTAQWSHDRLRLVQAAKSMRGLFVCYSGFTDSLAHMFPLACQREKVMIIEHKKEKLAKSLAKIQNNLQLLCDSTQNCIRNPSDSVMAETKDEVVECMSLAIKEVIEAVKKIDTSEENSSSEEYPEISPSGSTTSSETLATNLVKAYGTLSPTNRFTMSPQLDIYIDAILKNSMVVADSSKPHYEHAIKELCQEVIELHKRLSASLEECQRDPSSQDANARFNQTADLLCSKFLDLDKLVAQSVADQVAETFVDTSTTINQLIRAVPSSAIPVVKSSSPTGTESLDTESSGRRGSTGSEDLEKNITLFRRHSLKLSEVAVQAAQGTVDNQRAKQVKFIASELVDLTDPVVSAALKVKQEQSGHDQLQDLGRLWGNKAQQLKGAVDEIISPSDFTAATEANIVGEMLKGRQAMEQQNWEELMTVVQSIAAKGRRVAEVARTSLVSMKDPLEKEKVSEALKDLENSVVVMIEQAEYLASHPGDEQAEAQFAGSMEEVLMDIQHIQKILPPATSGSLTAATLTTEPTIGISEPMSTSTPISQAPFQTGHLQLSKGANAEPLPLLKFSDIGPSPYSIRPSAGTRTLGTQSQIPTMVDVSIGTQNGDFSVGTQVPKASTHSTGTQISNEEGISIGTQSRTPLSSVGIQMDHPLPLETPPTTLPGLYRAMSPSDEWIYQPSTKETSPSSFAPTNTSPDPYGQDDDTDISLGQSPRRKTEDAVQYPSSLGGLNVTPSLYKMLNNQSDFSLTSEYESKDTRDPPGSDPQYLGTFTQPLQDVLTAADQGNMEHINTHASCLSKRTNRLAKMAETASTATNDPKLASILQEKSARLAHLTPQIIRQATLKAQNGESVDSGDYKDLDVLVHQWTGHVRSLLDASQRANIPWSRTAGRLVSSAKKRSGLNREIGHVTGHTDRMVNVATSSIEAASTEDNIGSTGNLDHQPDPETKHQIEHVQCQIREIRKITPKFISTAENVAVAADTHIAMETEQLNLLSQEWATKANALMKGVDDITIGMSGPPDSLLISIGSGDPALLDEQCRSLKEISLSMMKISEDSVLGCSDEERVDMVLKTAHTLQDISQELVECARGLAKGKGETGEEQEVLVERVEILRRDWSAKMHLLTAHIDDLTAGVAGPIDRLVSVALQASRTGGMAKDYLMNQFEEKAAFTKSQLEVVSLELNKAVSCLSVIPPSLQNCSKAVAILAKVSPRAIESARVLSRDPGSAKLDHFSHLRRQWAAKAQNFQFSLNTVELDIDLTSVEMAFHDLLQGHKAYRRRSVTPEGRRQQRKREWVAKGEWEEDTSRGSLVRAYSDEDLGPPLGPAPPIPLEETDIEEKIQYPRPPGLSEPSTPLKQDTTPTKVVFRTPRSFTPDLSKKHLSVGMLPSWDERDDKDTSVNSALNASSASIVVAARTLKDAADQFMEEGNPLVVLAKKMSTQMYQMSEFARGKGQLQTKSDMIYTAKAIAANAEQIGRLAKDISEQCLDERMKASLQSFSDMIPTLSTQLKIIASVKSCNPNDLSADIMLVKNAQNLMQAVIETIQAAEAAYVKGLKPPAEGDTTIATMAIKWKRKLYIQRTMETISAPMGPKGLRRMNKNRFSTSTLEELIRPSPLK